jgi:hypothetical protein
LAGPLPFGATFTHRSQHDRHAQWTPDFTQAGTYSVTARIRRDHAVGSRTTAITVTDVNRAPVADADTTVLAVGHLVLARTIWSGHHLRVGFRRRV